jgi:hypothetical protein
MSWPISAQPFAKPYSAITVYGSQIYRTNCGCPFTGTWTTLYEPFGGISRSFSQNGDGTWRFTLSKSANGVRVLTPLP